MERGEHWAYRARQKDPLVEVEILRQGSSRPPRVQIRFVADEFEGREEWVPPARLKVPWQQASDYQQREDQWERLRELGIEEEDPRQSAADEVCRLLIDESLAELGYRDRGALTITRPRELAEHLGLEVDQLTQHPATFFEEGKVIVPWEVTELVVTTAVRRDPDPILRYLATEERLARHHAIHGQHLGYGKKGYYISPDHSAEFDADYHEPIRKVLRSWCPGDAVERFDELVELRKEIHRVGEIAQLAIEALRQVGHDSLAEKFAQALGTPVEMLRVDPDQT